MKEFVKIPTQKSVATVPSKQLSQNSLAKELKPRKRLPHIGIEGGITTKTSRALIGVYKYLTYTFMFAASAVVPN